MSFMENLCITNIAKPLLMDRSMSKLMMVKKFFPKGHKDDCINTI